MPAEKLILVLQIEPQNQRRSRQTRTCGLASPVADAPAERMIPAGNGIKFIKVELLLFRLQFEPHPAAVLLLRGKTPGRRRQQTRRKPDRLLTPQIVPQRQSPVRPARREQLVAEKFRPAPEIEGLRQKRGAAGPFGLELNPVGKEGDFTPDGIFTAADEFQPIGFAAEILPFQFQLKRPGLRRESGVRNEDEIRIPGTAAVQMQQPIAAPDETTVMIGTEIQRTMTVVTGTENFPHCASPPLGQHFIERLV